MPGREQKRDNYGSVDYLQKRTPARGLNRRINHAILSCSFGNSELPLTAKSTALRLRWWNLKRAGRTSLSSLHAGHRIELLTMKSVPDSASNPAHLFTRIAERTAGSEGAIAFEYTSRRESGPRGCQFTAEMVGRGASCTINCSFAPSPSSLSTFSRSRWEKRLSSGTTKTAAS